MYYDNVEYAKGRLKNSIVNLEDGRPVYVIDIDGLEYVLTQSLVEEERVVVKLTDLDLTPVKLGWVNFGAHCIYATRIPIRGVWKQGLCRDNVKFLSPFNNKAHCPMPSPSLGHTILGQYPTFDSAVRSVIGIGKDTKAVAFSRNWAITSSNLLYKGRIVGNHDQGELLLNRQHEYLEETLQEEVSKSRGYC